MGGNHKCSSEFKCQGLERDLKEGHRMEMQQLTSGDCDGGAQEKSADSVDEKANSGKEETPPTYNSIRIAIYS